MLSERRLRLINISTNTSGEKKIKNTALIKSFITQLCNLPEFKAIKCFESYNTSIYKTVTTPSLPSTSPQATGAATAASRRDGAGCGRIPAAPHPPTHPARCRQSPRGRAASPRQPKGGRRRGWRRMAARRRGYSLLVRHLQRRKREGGRMRRAA